MDQLLRKLTLIYPPAVEDHIVDLLVNAEPPLAGFTTWKAEGHGLDFRNASVRERVRGRVALGMLVLILPRLRLSSVLEDIRLRVDISDLTYWVEPIEAFGRLAHVPAIDVATAESAA